ncbi:HpcH/HpaI aldolase/citrate lyase family protein [Klebsiella sp. BIGb0407]|uniref:HpcH/HpaI aldolase family protein n=1 Tax=Klebsiella sp. BIGb0407 TaxID=2940603 RepID=UPI002167338C|nr:aldolase/citrate lyase family protein [Klebsiella sp. BIGb0407]MCS3429870.1 2-keto-3-deoxy-L-rhamnonate aldolase RhmA [Klebsiella sp. BIGb0407]
MPDYNDQFKRRLLGNQTLVGTFLKVPSGHITEMLGAVGYDFVIIDQEHAPFDRLSTDNALLAAKAWEINALVRVPSAQQEHILAALDGGATGVLVPHVQSAEQAKAIVNAGKYHGERGFALATRAASWGQKTTAQHIAESDSRTVIIAQIEDLSGLENVEAIAAVEGIDAIFIGRGDLSVSLGARTPNDPVVFEACQTIATAVIKQGKALSAYMSTEAEVKALAEIGVTTFMYGSDQALFMSAARQAATIIRSITGDNQDG